MNTGWKILIIGLIVLYFIISVTPKALMWIILGTMVYILLELQELKGGKEQWKKKTKTKI